MAGSESANIWLSDMDLSSEENYYNRENELKNKNDQNAQINLSIQIAQLQEKEISLSEKVIEFGSWRKNLSKEDNSCYISFAGPTSLANKCPVQCKCANVVNDVSCDICVHHFEKEMGQVITDINWWIENWKKDQLNSSEDYQKFLQAC